MRTTDDKKDNRVIVRLNDMDNEYLRRESARLGLSISDFVRMLIDAYRSGDKRFPKRLGEKESTP